MPNTPDSTGSTPPEPQEVIRKPRFDFQTPRFPIEPETDAQIKQRIILNQTLAREQSEAAQHGQGQESFSTVTHNAGHNSSPQDVRRAVAGLPIETEETPSEAPTPRHTPASEVREENRQRTAHEKQEGSSERPVRHVQGAYIEPWHRKQGRDRHYRNTQGRGGRH